MNTRRQALAALGLVTVLSLTACTPFSDTNTWVLTSLSDADGEYFPSTTDLPVTIHFDNGGVNGNICNSFSGRATGWGNSFSIDWLAATEMACMEPANAMDIEARFLDDLTQVTTIYRDNDTLKLTGPGLSLEFVID